MSDETKRYAQRDIEDLGGFYMDNLNAMTAEQLHSKSAICAELAFRDKRIAELEAVHNKAQALYNSIGTHASGRKWVEQSLVDELGFALCDLSEGKGNG